MEVKPCLGILAKIGMIVAVLLTKDMRLWHIIDINGFVSLIKWEHKQQLTVIYKVYTVEFI